MVTFFSVMVNVTTVIAMIAMVIFFGGILFGSKSIADKGAFANCDGQIKACRIGSVLFTLFLWLVVSGYSQEECLEWYTKISTMSLRIGCAWIIFAFVNIVLSIGLAVAKKDDSSLAIMSGFRKSSIVMGIIFLLISFLLKVN